MVEPALLDAPERSDFDFDQPFGVPDAPVVRSRRAWRDAVHPRLDELPPGIETAAFGLTVDRAELSGSDRVALLRAHQRLINRLHAELYRDMLAIEDLYRDQAGIQNDVEAAFATEAEVRAALGWTRRRTERELSLALDLGSRLPILLEAMEAGRIDAARARILAHATENLPTETARSIVDELIDGAPELTTGQLAARARSLASAAEPTSAAQRQRSAHDRCRVVLEATSDGTGNVHALDLAPQDAAAITRRISRLARRATTADDPRTADQVRADVLVDLVLGRSASPVSGPTTESTSGAGRADIQLRVDLTTLIGLDDRPATIAEFGPIVAEIARDIARHSAGGRWTHLAVDPDTGQPVATGPIRRRPTAAQARMTRALRTTCVFPGCRAPAVECDLDHTTPWAAGGATEIGNLAPLCRHDHRIKSQTAWTYEAEPDHGIVWTSPFGRRYRRGPPTRAG